MALLESNIYEARQVDLEMADSGGEPQILKGTGMGKSTTGVIRLVRGLGTILIGVFAAMALMLLAAAAFAETDESGVTRVADHPVMTVLSDSMTPEFKAGDLIVESSVGDKADRLATGNVITFRMREGSGELVTHRIIQVKGSASEGTVTYRTQGDANNAPDRTAVTPEQIVGVYSWHIPYGGYVLDVMRSPTAMFLLVFIPALLLLLPLFAKWWRAAGEPQDDAGAVAEAADEAASPALVPVGVREGGTDQLET